MIRLKHLLSPSYVSNVSQNCNRWTSRMSAALHSSEWQPVIGLEVHAQIATESKLFSSSSAAYGGLVNNQVALFDAALPGTLPVLNKQCVEAGVKTSLALNCHINMVSYFDRKHYFYADLPAGYQITQQRQPLAKAGKLSYVIDNQTKHVGIWQLQLEQDSGKSLHDPDNGISLIDLNRAGVGLMEIVTAPEFQSSEEAAAFVKELQLILRTLGTCDCKMQEGSFRVDASVSLHRPGEPLGTRSEVKNLNSIRFIKKAIDYELKRQRKILDDGGTVENETRSYDHDTNTTVAMRDKEKVHDYRFLPEPNLLPLQLYDDSTPSPPEGINIDIIKKSMPVLPEERRNVLINKYGLTPHRAKLVVNEPGLWELFIELCDSGSRAPDNVHKVLVMFMLGPMYVKGTTFPESSLTIEQIGHITDLYQIRKISSIIADKIFTKCLENPGLNVEKLVNDKGWIQITDPDTITDLCNQVIADNPHVAKKCRQGKKKYLERLINKVMSESNDLADRSLVGETLKDKILSQDQPKS